MMKQKLCYLLLVVTCFIISCNQNKKDALFQLEKNAGISFTNSIESSDENNVFKYRNFYNGGGAAAGDLNNDGLPEVFFTANNGDNKLFLNKGNFQFEDITEKSGLNNKGRWSTGIVFADINADGWLDIYVCNAGNMMQPALRKNQLYINNKNLTFTEQAASYGLDNDGYTTHASFFDYDLDGDLDCFMVNNSPMPVNTFNYANMRDLPAKDWDVKDFLKGGGDHFYKNENGKFTEVTKLIGLHGSLISLGLGVTVGDVNGDHYPDVYVSNDFFERDYLYINQQNGTFKDEFENWIQHSSLSSMGADMNDINNDGFPDIFTTDMLPGDDYRLKANSSFEGYEVFQQKLNLGFYYQFTQNALQVNNRNGKFLETAFYSGVAASDWSWGALLFDADNDGLTDIYVCNGIYHDVTDQDFIDFFADEVMQQMVLRGKKEEVNNIIKRMPSNPIPNNMFHNKGNLHFENTATEWGLDKPSFSNGAVYADLDNDGDLDLLVNNVNMDAFVYRNTSREKNKNNYISIKLKANAPNTFAVGSSIKAYAGNQIISREVIPARGFQSSVDYVQTIGLGKGSVDSIVITWPDRTVTVLQKPAINQLHVIEKSPSTKPFVAIANTETALFEAKDSSFETHREDHYVDFFNERNIPFMLSKQGPKAAVGDVNDDGLDDIFIGGAKGQPSQLYLQTAKGFIKKEIPDFKTYSFNDITAALFFDCDKDGDLDLFAGGGGNFANAASGMFQNFLYINDGKGMFTLKRGAVPPALTNCGSVTPVDYNEDGLMDLFVGSRSVPQSYGQTPQSFLLKNKGNGNFEDVTAAIAPAFQTLGMVTAAAVADINGDGKQELIVTGDWMYTHIFSISQTKMEELKSTGLEKYRGWWQTMKTADADKDGDMDLILGNIGENFYLQVNDQNPASLYLYDFDQNGLPEKVLSRTINNREVPVFMRREMADQIPSLKKQNLRHSDYAKKTVQDLFGSNINKAQKLTVNYSSNCIAYNNGKGIFTVKALPMEIQLSSVNAIDVTDVNNDGYPDLLMAGNFFDLLPQLCRLDASYGHVLINDQKGGFTVLPMNKTGINVPGQTRDIVSFNYGRQTNSLFLVNNATPVWYQFKNKK
ncbi:MAG: VCBS repeat-containing protein [Chitinophagaceae bacterium]|nr:VCBS repeat-containing protein [Chitinophagaceae bacterium]